MTSEDTRESVELSGYGDAAFATLMDALAPEGEGEVDAAGGAGGVDAGAAPAGGGVPGSEGQQPPAAAGGADTPGAGAPTAGLPTAGEQPGSGDAAGGAQGDAGGSAAVPPAVGAGADLPADWTASVDEVLPKFGELSTKLEEAVTDTYKQAAFNEARSEYGRYFEALEKHPRLLVGTEVPAIGKEGMERLRDTSDAKEWQEAVKSILIQEIDENVRQKMEADGQKMSMLHASIDLFKNNKDLIPGTKQFDRQLADEFAKLVQPYEVRVDDKLQGYSIPVQPIIDSIRERLKVSRTAAAAPPEAAAPQSPSPRGSAPPAAAQSPGPPQAGIESKAGASAEVEDFSTLFGTIGLPHLQI